MDRKDFLLEGFVLTTLSGRYKIVAHTAADEYWLMYTAVVIESNSLAPGTYVTIREFFPHIEATRNAATGVVTPVGYAVIEYSQMLADFVDQSKKFLSVAGYSKGLGRMIDVAEVNGTAYCIMEQTPGETLESYLATKGALGEDKVLDLLLPIVSGVAEIHSLKMVHSGICPKNIMVVNDGSGNECAVLQIMPSPGMSPYSSIEQFARVKELTPASDVYSMAATMVNAITGNRLPMAAEMTPDKLMALLAPVQSEKLRAVLRGAMATRAVERPTTAIELKDLILQATGRTDTVPADNMLSPGFDAETIPTAGYHVDQPTVPIAPVGGSVTPPMPSMDGGYVVASSPATPPPLSSVPPIPPVPNVGQPTYAQPMVGNHYRTTPTRMEEPDPMVDRKSSHTIVYIIIIVLLAVAIGLGIYLLIDKLSSKNPEEGISSSEWENMYGSDGQGSSNDGPHTLPIQTPIQKEEPPKKENPRTTPSVELSSQGRYDMAFHGLVPGSGVKSLSYSGLTFRFNRNGEWANDDYVDVLYDRAWTYEGSRRSSESYTMKDGSRGTMYYTWDGSDVVRMVDQLRGYTVERTYNGDGQCLESTTYYDDGRPSKTIYYSNYVTDRHGNWTSRRTSRGVTETRTLKYYD